MATREEIADILAGFTLFGDLQTPQLLGVAGVFEEVLFPAGERILRQGLTGSGFYVILDGTADVRIDGQQRATLGRGDFFGEVSILLGEPPTADVVASTPLRCIQIAGPDVQGFLVDQPAGHVPDAPGPGAATPQREPLAELSPVDPDARPFPPGEYPVIVIGSGPGGLQISLRPQALRRAARGAVGRSVARWHVPPLAVLPAAAVVDQALRPRGRDGPRVPALRLEQPDRVRARAPLAAGGLHGRLVVLSLAARDGGEPRVVRRQGGPRHPLRLPLGPHPARGRPRRSDLHPRDDRRRVPLRTLVLAVGIAQPWTPNQPGIEHAPPLRGDARGVLVRRQAPVHHRQAELGLRAGVRPRRLGLEDHGGVAVARQDVGPDEVAGRRPGALRAAVRGQLPGSRGLDPRRLHRRDRAHRATPTGCGSSGPTTGSR